MGKWRFSLMASKKDLFGFVRIKLQETAGKSETGGESCMQAFGGKYFESI
jgi:hypothetical protein